MTNNLPLSIFHLACDKFLSGEMIKYKVITIHSLGLPTSGAKAMLNVFSLN